MSETRDKLIELGLWDTADLREPDANDETAGEVLDAMLDRDGPFGDYKMTFGLEYSSIVDWVASLVPARGHPKARDYENWWQGAFTRREAIVRAVVFSASHLKDHEEEQEATATNDHQP